MYNNNLLSLETLPLWVYPPKYSQMLQSPPQSLSSARRWFCLLLQPLSPIQKAYQIVLLFLLLCSLLYVIFFIHLSPFWKRANQKPRFLLLLYFYYSKRLNLYKPTLCLFHFLLLLHNTLNELFLKPT